MQPGPRMPLLALLAAAVAIFAACALAEPDSPLPENSLQLSDIQHLPYQPGNQGFPKRGGTHKASYRRPDAPKVDLKKLVNDNLDANVDNPYLPGQHYGFAYGPLNSLDCTTDMKQAYAEKKAWCSFRVRDSTEPFGEVERRLVAVFNLGHFDMCHLDAAARMSGPDNVWFTDIQDGTKCYAINPGNKNLNLQDPANLGRVKMPVECVEPKKCAWAFEAR